MPLQWLKTYCMPVELARMQHSNIVLYLLIATTVQTVSFCIKQADHSEALIANCNLTAYAQLYITDIA